MNSLRVTARLAAIFSILLGGAVLVGWAGENAALKSVAPGFVSMKANTAIMFVLSGLALLLRTEAAGRRIVALLAGIVGLISVLVLFEYASGISTGIGELFFRDVDPVLTSHPGRPSPLTGIAFGLLALQLVLGTSRKRASDIGQAALLVGFLVVLLALLGYAFRAERFFGATEITTGMALHTAFGLAILLAGAQLLMPHTERALRERDTPAMGLLFLLVPAAIVIPIVVASGLVWLGDLGLYGQRFRVALHTVVTILVLIGVILVAAARVGRLEAMRQAEVREAYSELRLAYAEVEGRVRDRTAELEAAMTRSERLASIVAESSDAIVGMDRKGHVVTWNAGARASYGYEAGEAIGSPFLELVVPDAGRDEAERIVEKVLSGQKVRRARVARKRKDGRMLTVDVTAFPLRDPAGGIVGLASIARDVTDQVTLENALRRSNEDLQEFAQVASHDLQEPLRMVASYCELLEERYADELDDAGREFIGFAVDGARRMQILIEDLLTFARVATRGREFSEIDARAPVDDAVGALQSAIEESGARIEIGDLPTVAADEAQLRQLFQNLIGNAVKFARPDEPPVVRVAAKRGEREWIFEVRDNGIGIEPMFAKRIFEPFQRLHTREEYPGTGMGLAICRRIVERRGGHLWLEPAEGGGSRFRFTLPDDLPKRVAVPQPSSDA